jgi:hypothetical protein
LAGGLAVIITLLLIAFKAYPYTYVAVAPGNWTAQETWKGKAPGTNVNAQDITIPEGIQVNLDADVIFSGKENTLTINGSLRGLGKSKLFLNAGTIAGNGSISIYALQFSDNSKSTFTGISSFAILRSTGAGIALAGKNNISDTLDLNEGTVIINQGGEITLLPNALIRVNNGRMEEHGGTFTSDRNYNIMYTGTSKEAGIELNSKNVNNMYVQLSDNSQTLTLNNSGFTVNGNMYFTMGQIELNNTALLVKGDLDMVMGVAFAVNGPYNPVIEGNTFFTSVMTEDEEPAAATEKEVLQVENSAYINVDVYPNPSKDFIWVELSGTSNNYQYEIQSFEGFGYTSTLM